MGKWWKEVIFYEVYMPSFCDGNGDGIGDFKGITSKLDYLDNLGIKGLWLTPFYKSPKIDNGYDIEDYYEIDEDYGTLEDFKVFLFEAHKRGIKVIADLVLNHTSSKHKWFAESQKTKKNSKRDWYIWRAGQQGKEPNNWESFFSGSAWEYDKNTCEYYYHAFAKEQVDLNWSNPQVKEAMFDVIRYWLELGIDGFRLDVINFLKTEKNLIDNPYDKHERQLHLNDKDQRGVLEVIKEIRTLVDSYGDKFLVGEVGSEDLNTIMMYTGEDKLHVAFNFNLGSIPKLNSQKIYEELKKMENDFSEKIPTLFFGSHDMSRFISRFSDGTMDEERAKLIAALMLTAKGVPFVYFGEEIGMRDFLPEEISQMRDIQGILAYNKALAECKSKKEAMDIGNNANRDKSRTPMQWNSGKYCGFSDKKPWINIPNTSKDINVEKQLKDANSMLNYYKKLINIRNNSLVLQYGKYKELNKKNDIIYYIREKDNIQILVMLNFSNKNSVLQWEKLKNYNLLLSSRRNSLRLDNRIELMPYEAVVAINKLD